MGGTERRTRKPGGFVVLRLAISSNLVGAIRNSCRFVQCHHLFPNRRIPFVRAIYYACLTLCDLAHIRRAKSRQLFDDTVAAALAIPALLHGRAKACRSSAHAREAAYMRHLAY